MVLEQIQEMESKVSKDKALFNLYLDFTVSKVWYGNYKITKIAIISMNKKKH